jgi:hypothetical protein
MTSQQLHFCRDEYLEKMIIDGCEKDSRLWSPHMTTADSGRCFIEPKGKGCKGQGTCRKGRRGVISKAEFGKTNGDPRQYWNNSVWGKEETSNTA